MTIQGLLTQKPGNEPTVGQVKNFNVENRISQNGKAWTKIRNPSQDNVGSPYKVISVKPTGFTDQHGNVSFNIEIEPANGSPTSQNAPGRVVSQDERSNRIERQHSQEMALRYATLKGADTLSNDQLRQLIDWFQRDVGRMPSDPIVEQAKEIFNAEETPQEAVATDGVQDEF